MTIGTAIIEHLRKSGETAIIRSSSNAEEASKNAEEAIEWSIHPLFMTCRSPVRMNEEVEWIY